MAILDAGDIASEKAGTLFDVALGELLFLTQFAEAVAESWQDYSTEASRRQAETEAGILFYTSMVRSYCTTLRKTIMKQAI